MSFTSFVREIHSSTHTPLAQDRSRGRRRDRGERNRPSEVGHPVGCFGRVNGDPATMFVGSPKKKRDYVQHELLFSRYFQCTLYNYISVELPFTFFHNINKFALHITI